MGNPRGEQEELAAIREISKLSKNAREHIGHHVRNAIQPFLLVCDCNMSQEDREALVSECFSHVVAEINKIGC